VEAAAREVEDPVSHQRVVFRRTGADTNGEVLELDLYVGEGAWVRTHIHPTQEETFTGVSGVFVVEVDGKPHRIGPGESVTVPPLTPHGFREAPEPAKLLVTVRPALRLDEYFRVYMGLSRDRRIRVPFNGIPRPLLQVALVMKKFAPELAAPRIPLSIQRPLWGLLAALGRRRGYAGSFPEYGAP
jgi:quercetin dioxygenase-like cupin family protein